ncbi:MAG: competence/damage-inducible protein A [Alphaproteobacteria bacterium]|jgi:molybdenum cofactor synthesis domain-containing protein|nr:competence/damage-inducible protein A [Alphaproteobacteria bacterium]
MSEAKTVTAALVIIGNEILSGRTQDVNLAYIAGALGEIGVRLMEVRVVPDVENEIVDAVNTLRAKYDYLFTTGGIGPTHDDITAECVAKAFGLPLIQHPEARRRLVERYEQTGMELNEARLRMANTPEGAELIDNPISTAPGFKIENVYVMAGVPMIAQAMIDGVKQTLAGGDPVHSRTLVCSIGEGNMAEGLGKIQDSYPVIDIGSYPYYRRGKYGTSIVLRHTDEALLESASEEVAALMRSFGDEPRDEI